MLLLLFELLSLTHLIEMIHIFWATKQIFIRSYYLIPITSCAVLKNVLLSNMISEVVLKKKTKSASYVYF